MSLEDFGNEYNDPELIPGIFNYCDRWCERCRLSSYCLVYKMEHQSINGQKNYDSANEREEDFWEQLKSTLKKTHDLVIELAEEMDLDTDDLDKLKIDEGSKQEKAILKHPVTKAAEQYFFLARDWLLNNGQLLQRKGRLIKYQSGVKKKRKSADIYLILNDLYDIINWYHSMIPVKAKRAVAGIGKEEWGDEIQNDMNGTAKVLNLCVERSLFAWNSIERHLEKGKEEIELNKKYLNKLQELIEHHFPNAEEFIRPGFDEQ
ncbi:hypothetical protein [Gracilimonas mengyeensis]|uniref:Uncharacterized protein n=1 Tax=Gracilimonas mengyeensis TaxID=1302730 RepID=A0A521CT39_9BACT|nr:hypothetical protein [Gracilimonas mengyeensis]SMO61881.1 hypothetical protein SAMN06265219_10685 [Gracilimonas mengyeensis]